MIRSHGYPAEEHHVITSDGYNLTLHRIPGPRDVECLRKESCPKRPPVYVQHGLICSSADFIVAGPKQGLAYILADAGYDVWMGNCRGNTYSRKHIRMKPFQRQFWRFTWHEMGTIDIPEMIDYVLNQTQEQSLHYVGHSQGTTTFFVMASVLPEFNSKIRGAHLLAPAAYMSNMNSPLIRTLAPLVDFAEVIFNVLGSGEVLASGDVMSLAGQRACEAHVMTMEMCSNLLFLFVGFNSDQFNVTLLPEIAKRNPAGVSTRSVLHYVQEVRHHKFCQYDHGSMGNQMRYGQRDPPEYNLGNVTAPVYLYYSNNDWLVSRKDVKKLKKTLPNIKFKYLIPLPSWNHIDFLWARNVKTVLYDVIVANMRRSDNQEVAIK